MKRPATLTLLCALLAALGTACGPPSVRPASFPNSSVSCPGAQVTWNLQIVDQRATRGDEARVVGAVRDAIQKSFPGCRWSGPQEADSGTIAIEIHRFQSVSEPGSWEAAVEWSVSARNAGGTTLTEFEANEEVSRPNYQGSDNEKESLSEAFSRAVERTAKGLTAISVTENLRPRQGTPGTTRPSLVAEGPAAVNRSCREGSRPDATGLSELERNWQC